MTSYDDLNDTTKNLILALENYKPAPSVQVIIKLTYDAETGFVNGLTFEDTDLPYVEITRKQYDEGIQYKKLRVVDNKLIEVKKDPARKLQLVAGDTWHTTAGNMLIIGNDDGWARRDS